MNNKELQETKYFELRNYSQDESGEKEQAQPTPSYIKKLLPHNHSSPILDIGCGYGGMLLHLKSIGYTNLHGVDIHNDSIDYCNKKGLHVKKINSIIEYCTTTTEKFDCIIMTHVIEHIKKDEIIATLTAIKKILNPGGVFYLTTPNAQSRSGCYWAYEDFTHELVFTSGSLLYVLKAAGFSTVDFVDPDNIENSNIKIFKKIFLFLYRKNDYFWNKITGAAYHPKSPVIYSWELKVSAKI